MYKGPQVSILNLDSLYKGYNTKYQKYFGSSFYFYYFF